MSHLRTNTPRLPRRYTASFKHIELMLQLGMGTTKMLTLLLSAYGREPELTDASAQTKRLIYGLKPVGSAAPSLETLDFSHTLPKVT